MLEVLSLNGVSLSDPFWAIESGSVFTPMQNLCPAVIL